MIISHDTFPDRSHLPPNKSFFRNRASASSALDWATLHIAKPANNGSAPRHAQSRFLSQRPDFARSTPAEHSTRDSAAGGKPLKSGARDAAPLRDPPRPLDSPPAFCVRHASNVRSRAGAHCTCRRCPPPPAGIWRTRRAPPLDFQRVAPIPRTRPGAYMRAIKSAGIHSEIGARCGGVDFFGG